MYVLEIPSRFHLFGKIYLTEAGNIHAKENDRCYLTHINTAKGIGKSKSWPPLTAAAITRLWRILSPEPPAIQDKQFRFNLEYGYISMF